MKYLFLIFFFIKFSISNAQIEIDTINNIIYLDQVNEVKGTSKDLKDKAFEWVAKSYNNSNYVTRLNTDDKIITKGTFSTESRSYMNSLEKAEPIKYTLELSFKDGRYRTEIKDIESTEIMFSIMTKEQFKDWWVTYYENYTGIGKKFAQKKVQDDKYISNTYEKMKKTTTPILNELKLNMELVNASILSNMKSESKKDDW